MPYYETDPDDPEAPVALESYGYGLRLGVRVVYENPSMTNPDGSFMTAGMDPPLVLSALYRIGGEGPDGYVTAILNDGVWEVCADNLSLERCGHAWKDGWGEHACHLLVEHEGQHRCDCDATVAS